MRPANYVPTATRIPSKRNWMEDCFAALVNTTSQPLLVSPTTDQIIAGVDASVEFDIWLMGALIMHNVKDKSDPHVYAVNLIATAIQYIANVPEGTLQHPKRAHIEQALWVWLDKAGQAAGSEPTWPDLYVTDADKNYVCYMLILGACQAIEAIPSTALQHPKRNDILNALRVWARKALAHWVNNK